MSLQTEKMNVAEQIAFYFPVYPDEVKRDIRLDSKYAVVWITLKGGRQVKHELLIDWTHLNAN